VAGALAALGDEAGPAQNTEVVGGDLLRDVELPCDLAD